MNMRNRRWLPVVLGFLAAGVGRAQAQGQCAVLDQNVFVRDTLRDIYLWYQELPDLDPALYSSPEAYLDAVRYRPLDESFSYISSAQASSSYYSESQYIGLGFSFQWVRETRARISQVFPDSPSSEAGMARGDYLVAIGGRPIEELVDPAAFDAAIGPTEIGVSVEISWRSPFGEDASGVLTKRPVTIPTVSQKKVFDVDGLPVGYVHLRNFVEPSVSALDSAFAEFQAQGVTDVVLDLRYNGGGLIEVARHLGSLIGGFRTNGQPFVELVHNDKNSFRNRTFPFDDPEQSLDVPRLVVIATHLSASSSELVIQGLKPFVPVTVVGGRTYGKPVGQYGFEFCDKVLFPVSFRSQNARGESDFFDGIPADCPASDNLDRALGDPAESSLAEALYFLRRGECSPESEQAARALREAPPAARLTGWQALVNAY
jgi:C-terminal processing protease CtpA/Prc